jgi:cell wall-associated NlpC family hydrolase
VSSAPTLKRPLVAGAQGKDVEAIQRAVRRALKERGLPSGNKANGNYGDGTIADVRRWQQARGIQATGKTGQPTLNSLWQYVDGYGVELYFQAVTAKPVPLPSPPLRAGARGDRVRAAQQALWRALGSESGNIRNGVYGDGTVADVKRFLARTHWAGDGTAITAQTWAALWGFMDGYARALASTKPPPSGPAQVRSNLVTLAEIYVRLGGRYLQARPYQRFAPLSAQPLRNDCSGSIGHLFKLAGAPDPFGYGFNGYGYTGSGQSRGRRLAIGATPANLLCGDLLYFGNQGGGISSHMELYLGGGRVFGFGSTPPRIKPWGWSPGWLRTDIGARRYF